MADFRKWLYAFAVVALLAGLSIPASAQAGLTPTCTMAAATPTVRAEGYTEQVGDLTLACTGGTPTANGSQVPQYSFTVFLSQNVTSKITASLSAINNGTFLEALLIVDEPNTAANAATPILNCGNTGAPDNTGAGPGVCTIISNAGAASSLAQYNGTAGHPNVFQGRLGTVQNSGFPSSITFSGVPFDPPGTGTRFLRITNVRVNANGAGVGQANQTSFITESFSVTSGGNPFTIINQSTLTVAFVQKGLTSAIVKAQSSFAQCNSQVSGLPNASPIPNFGAGTGSTAGCNFPTSAGCVTTAGGTSTPTVRFIEGFNYAWKTKNVNFSLTNATATAGTYSYNGGLAYPADLNQNVPGVVYNSESGFVFSPNLTTPTPNPPAGFGTIVTGTPALPNPNPLAFANGFGGIAGTGIQNSGIATQGTRLATSLANVPNGLTVWVPPIVYIFRQGVTYTSPVSSAGASGVMVLTSTDSAGAGAFTPTAGITAASMPLQQVTITNGTGLVVYEILFADVQTLEYTDVPFVVSYASNTASNLPQPNTIATAALGFAPFYSTAAATQPSQTLPVPRFQFTGTPANLFGIIKCSCNLLWPYVTQAPGYDTGIAIANTTSDPYGTGAQTGFVQFWYYGSLSSGGGAPATQCTNTTSPGTCPGTTNIPSGQVLTYTLFNGSPQWGLDNRGVGFTGYMITQAQFQYCHGFAFISGLGGGPASGNGLSEGYLALVLDPAGLSRGTPVGESLGN